MRLLVAGTPEFARVALARLHQAGHEIVLVLSQPDRPAGRGLRLQPSPVKQFALAHGLPVVQPRSLRLEGALAEQAQEARAAILAARPDAMVVVAYGLILPPWMLALAPLGCFNIHASLLPRWRGAAPLQRAIEAGDATAGVTVMQMDAGLDTGDMLMRQSLPIEAGDTTGTLHDKLADLGAQLMVTVLAQAGAGLLRPVPQPSEGVCYAHKIEKAEAAIDWSEPATLIVRRIRAFNPAPGCSATLAGEVFKIWGAVASARPPDSQQEYGKILAVSPEFVEVLAMNSVVKITQLQRPGGKRLPVADFLRGFELTPGMRFERTAA